MKNRYRSFVVVVAAVLWQGLGSAEAGTYSVPLPEFIGEVGSYPDWNVAEFDFGTTFLEISEMRIQLGGTFTPGEERFYETGEIVDRMPIVEVFLENPATGFTGTHLYPIVSPFTMAQSLEYWGDESFDEWLGGTGVIIGHVGWSGNALGLSEMLSDGTMEFSTAYLVFEGVIPEPTSLLLVSLGVGLFGRCRGRRTGRVRMR